MIHIRSIIRGLATFACLLVITLGSGWTSAAEDDEADEPLYRPGLVAQFSGPGGTKAVRVDRALAFSWGHHPPDRRLPSGPFSVRWQGSLQTEEEGQYRLFAYAAGKVVISLNGKSVLAGESDRPVWMQSDAMEVPYDYYPLDIRYEKTGENAKFALYWSGPKFQLEPVGPRQLVHRREQAPAAGFERGEQLVRALRCTACHELNGEPPPLSAPDLSRLAGNISRTWLVDWLAGPHAVGNAHRGVPNEAIRRMPDFNLSREDAAAIAAHLGKTSQPAQVDSKQAASGKRADGKTLFVTLGCLACHAVGELGESGLFGGGDLTHVGDKRPAEFFARWLATPEQLNSQHRMPVFDLSAKERADLAAYLSELRGEEKPKESPPLDKANDEKLAARGQELFEKRGCQACHAPDSEAAKKLKRQPLSAKSRWDSSCLGAPDEQQARPGYRLPEKDAQAIATFVTAMSSVAKPVVPEWDGRYTLAERNCLACHARDASPGLAAKLPAVAEQHSALAPLVPALTPPPLASVGDKLHDSVLTDSITRKEVLRPWLKVRMPKFNLAPAEMAALVAHFVDADRIPVNAPAPEHPPHPNKETLLAAGARLVTADGFGCTSCHQVGKQTPPGTPLNARGPSLSLTGQRVRPEWFDRWVRNPARIVPRMEMPSVQIPVRGVLGEKLDDQLAAVWHVLNEPGFEPPLPGPVRVARRAGLENRAERALVLTDVLKQEKQTWTKPLLIGLSNRHNALLDLETNRLVAWWTGDTARQRTQGKSWYWEPAGTDLLRSGLDGSEVLLVRDGKRLAPLVTGQFPTEVDSWEHIPDGIRFQRRLRFAGRKDPLVVTVSEEWLSFWFLAELDAGGWSRNISIHGVPVGESIEFRMVAKERIAADLRDDDWILELKGPGEARLEIDLDHAGQLDRSGTILLEAEDDGPLDVKLDYVANLPADEFPVEPPAAVPNEVTKLNVVPGYEAVRLPLPADIMPTALSWRADGKLVIASLKGQVFLAADKNDDGLPDTLTTFGDELAAPYGLLTGQGPGTEQYVDVVTKFALLRLRDLNGDGRADSTQTLASGWGHTADYHDWVVGIEQDQEGNRYLAIPCEQDKRSAAAANLRGKIVKLLPRKPTRDDPRVYRVEEFAGGQRFPMGLARSRSGDLFATDNQGNYNPFNELNHIVPGKRYGFFNSLEKAADFPAPAVPAAVELPHPWTRSVNGICFLYKPEAGSFGHGPFEGHLIGCEYDTRRLIRMSLEKVEGLYQGACYPFTYDTPRDETSLLGPLVCAVSPGGDLYVGCVRDSGWGGANNIGAVTRLRPVPDKLPAGIAEARVTKTGFRLDFTRAVDPKLAADPSNYSVSSYRRVATPAYGGPDLDRRAEKLGKVTLSPDALNATLELPELREGFVYEIRLKNLAGGKREFHPAEAYYTLRKAPK